MKELDFQPVMRPKTTLFMLTSVDGKISTGPTDDFDFDKDLPTIVSPEGLQQYYDLERETDLWTLCSGRTLEKVFALRGVYTGPRLPVTCVVVDSTHLTFPCYEDLCRKFGRVVIATHSPHYLRWGVKPELLMYNAHQVKSLIHLLPQLGCTHLTIQSGSVLNTEFIRAGLIDYVDLVVAPCIVGGQSTPSLFGGAPVTALRDICKLTAVSATVLSHDFVRLTYAVEKHES